MARPRQFRLPAFDDLLNQLRFAPVETRRRQMDAAERLIAEIEPDQDYPHDYIVFRLTSYRADAATTPTVYAGRRLLGDLVNFIQRISSDLPLTRDMVAGRTPIAASELPDRLGVSTKTIQRYRDVGLVCHYLEREDGRRQLVCFDDALDRFLCDHRDRVERAQRFTRIDRTDESAIIDEARARHAETRCSLNSAARALAEDHCRAYETIRMLLRRHDRRSADPIFGEEHGPLTQRDMRFIGRAVDFGVAPTRLAKHFGKSGSTIHRAIVRDRAHRLRAVPITWLDLPTFDRPDAEAIILQAPAATSRLDEIAHADDALTLIRAVRDVDDLDDETGSAIIAAYHLLKRRAAYLLADERADRSMAVIDRVETDLRWTTRLKQRLVTAALPAAIRSIDQALSGTIESQPADHLLALLDLAIVTVTQDIDSVDPSQGHHLQRRASLAVARRVAAMRGDDDRSRAHARHRSGRLLTPASLRAVTPWQCLLDPPSRLTARLSALDVDDRVLIDRRYGLDGRPPATMTDLAEALGVRASHCRRRVRALLAQRTPTA